MVEHIVAVDIGGTNTRVSIAGPCSFLYKVVQPTELEGDNTTIPNQVARLIEHARGYMSILSIDAVGVSTCSPFKRRGKYRSVIAPNLCGGLAKERGMIPNDWTEIPLEEVLSKLYHNIEIGNDCVTAVVAERTFGAAQGEDNCVYVTWSTGIGTGAYVDGVLIKGKNGNAPHGGHIYIAESGPQCGCGNYGDLEALCSGTAIGREYGEGATSADVFDAYAGRNNKAIEIVERAAKNFARGLASINAVLDTRVFVIGGSVFENNKDTLLPLVKDEFYRSFPALSESVEIRPSALGSYLEDMAALSLVIPESWVEHWLINEPWKTAPPTDKLPRYKEMRS